ncbi:MAG TPA: ubiquinol-cytochrome c reductase iron-sulfur subunit [Vicinamibacterales bacterium]|nr:ubiquinol-cytochrome c reductase iron-sulfur subunit [Vicinamibacterales bacterium]
MHRRSALALFVNATAALLVSALSALLGAFTLRPPRRQDGQWLRAAALDELPPNVPVPCVVPLARQDGWYRERTRTAVFLVSDGRGEVQAFSATCTHLGCQVRWDAADARFRCPCHGGAFDRHGRVVEGPPPRALDRVEVRVDDERRAVLVRL